MALVWSVRRFAVWRRTRSIDDLLQLSIDLALLLTALTWHNGASLLLGVLLVVWVARRYGFLKTKRERHTAASTLASVRQVAEQYRTMGNDSWLARKLAAAAALPDLVGLSSRDLVKKLDGADLYLRRPIVEQLAERADATALDALAAGVASERIADTKALMLLALEKAGRSVDSKLWLDVLRDAKSEEKFKVHAIRELVARNVHEVVPPMFEAADRTSTSTKGATGSGPLVLEVTHAALLLEAHDALRTRAVGPWIRRYVETATERLVDRKSRAITDATVAGAKAFHALLAQETGPQPQAAQRIDWMLQHYEVRRTFTDYERQRTAAPTVVTDTAARVRFRVEQAMRWDALPDGALALEVGWHEAHATLDFETRAQAADGVDVPRLRLSLHAAGAEHEVDALLDTSSLLDLALAPSTPRAFLLRCPDDWRNALQSELRLTNAKGLNDSREHVELTIERGTLEVRLKHQGPRFDFALLPARREPTASDRAHGADETRLLLVVRGVTADLSETDEVAELPPFMCALRFEALLGSLEAMERQDDKGEWSEPPNPRVRRRQS